MLSREIRRGIRAIDPLSSGKVLLMQEDLPRYLAQLAFGIAYVYTMLIPIMLLVSVNPET